MSNLQHCTSLQDATGELDYRLTNDCMFHVVFQKNPKALLGLCASLLHMHPEQIRSVEVLNPLEFKKMPTDKAFVLDLKVMLNDDRILNFEVQVVDEKDWPERSLTYACRTFDQLRKGDSYLDVKPVRHIGFLDYDIKDFSAEFYATYKLLNVKNYELFSDKFALSVVNLNQIELATEEDRKYGIDHWARLFKATTWEAIKKWHKKMNTSPVQQKLCLNPVRMSLCASSWKVWKRQTAFVADKRYGWNRQQMLLPKKRSL